MNLVNRITKETLLFSTIVSIEYPGESLAFLQNLTSKTLQSALHFLKLSVIRLFDFLFVRCRRHGAWGFRYDCRCSAQLAGGQFPQNLKERTFLYFTLNFLSSLPSSQLESTHGQEFLGCLKQNRFLSETS